MQVLGGASVLSIKTFGLGNIQIRRETSHQTVGSQSRITIGLRQVCMRYSSRLVSKCAVPSRAIDQPDSTSASSPAGNNTQANASEPLEVVEHDREMRLAKDLTNRLVAAASAEELLQLAAVTSERFTHIHAAVTLHQLAKHAKRMPSDEQRSLRYHPVVAKMLDIVLSNPAAWDATSMTNILYAESMLQLGTPDLLRKIKLELHQDRDYDPSQIVRVAYGMAKLDIKEPKLLKKLDCLIEGVIEPLIPQSSSSSSSKKKKKKPSGKRKEADGGSNSNSNSSGSETEDSSSSDGELSLSSSSSSSTSTLPSVTEYSLKDITLLAWSLSQLYDAKSQAPSSSVITRVFTLAVKSLTSVNGQYNVPYQSIYMLTSSATSCPVVSVKMLKKVFDVVCTALAANQVLIRTQQLQQQQQQQEQRQVKVRKKKYSASTTVAEQPGMTARECSSIVNALAKLIGRVIQEESGRGGSLAPHAPTWRHHINALVKKHPSSSDALFLLVGSMERLAPQMNVQALTMTAWATAMLQIKRRPLAQAIEDRAVELAHKLSAQAVSQICWSFSVLHIDSERLTESIAGAAADMLCDPDQQGDFSPQALALLVYSLAVVDRCSGPNAKRLLQVIADYSVEILDEFSPQGRCNLAWGFAVAGFYPLEFFTNWRNVVAEASNMQQQEQQQKQQVLVETKSPSSLQNLNSNANNKQHLGVEFDPKTVFTPQELAQLYQVETALRLEAPHIGRQTPQDYVSFFDALYRAGRYTATAKVGWRSQQTEAPRMVSRYQQQVYDAVRALNIDCEFEYHDDSVQYPIDVAILSHKIAVEADGPTHFSVNTKRALGATALKQRILKKLGWKPVSIPFFEWSQYPNLEEQQAYIKVKLESCGLFDPIVKTALGPSDNGESVSMMNVVPFATPPPSEEEMEEIKERAQQMDLMKYRQGSLSKSRLLERAIGRKVAGPVQVPRLPSVLKENASE